VLHYQAPGEKKAFNNERGKLFFYKEKRAGNDVMTLNIKLISKGKKKPSIIIQKKKKINISPSIIFAVECFFCH